MKTIYDELVSSAENGVYFSVDLKTKSLKIGKEMVINEGEYTGELIGDLPRDPWEMLEELFVNYNLSRPGRWSERKKSYFAAKNIKEMSDIELACGEDRLVAQAKLEGFVLCAVLSNLLTWNRRSGWFWKSPRHPELVLLKEWF